jgi:hypothetical protein
MGKGGSADELSSSSPSIRFTREKNEKRDQIANDLIYICLDMRPLTTFHAPCIRPSNPSANFDDGLRKRSKRPAVTWVFKLLLENASYR